MFLPRIFVAGACLTFGMSSAALAANEPDTHQIAVTAVALGQRCKKLDPNSATSIDNLLLDKSVSGEMKTEIIKVSTNPSYKGEVDMVEFTMSDSKFWSVIKGMCKNYLPPAKS
ncbi:hypothetical protein GIV19_16810 [Pseudomonas syringae]|uniref:hypothetical protein n=1 Tax=Pseudomonas syringae TaxID=317 RepID=UPI001F1BD164|nr:hypothetical protein [Pseudomonas syringae]MCF5708944.1 hypothetical protein [Pseudomonas syringae]